MEATEVHLPWWQKLRWRQTSHKEAVLAERQLLSISKTNLTTSDVKIGQKPEHYMHTIHAADHPPHTKDAPALVYIPGYGAGAGFMFRTFDALSAGFRSFFVDLLGTGLSGRPPFPARSTSEAEAFFVDSLAEWRTRQGLDKMVLVGHSLGGYLSAVYALKYPEHVQHLILVCPAGVGRKPDDWDVPAVVKNPWTVRGQFFRLAVNAWDWGFTPGSFIRGLGPWGPKAVGRYTERRFKQGHPLSDQEIELFQGYMYHILAARGSGEYALRHLLAPFAWPRSALEERLHALKVPITFIYGEHDWMDAKAGRRVCETLKSATDNTPSKSATPKMPASHAQVVITPNAGHYPQIDQPGIFLQQILDTCKSYLPLAAQHAMAAEIAQLPYRSEPASDTAAQLKEEMEKNPIGAEAHVASDV